MKIVIRMLFAIRELISNVIAILIRPIIHDVLYKINRMNQENLTTAFMHQRVFPQFRNIHAGREVVIVACGPTMVNYKPIPGAIHIGLNRAFRNSNVPLDYLFFIDKSNFDREELMEFNNYAPDKCIKFYGIDDGAVDDCDWVVSESDVHLAKAYRFKTTGVSWAGFRNQYFAYDLSVQPLGQFTSVAFPALQFALWTNPKRIYLVGCDCSSAGHFYTETKEVKGYIHTTEIVEGYRLFKKFAETYYPDTEIVSINPVGLKGLFKDIEC